MASFTEFQEEPTVQEKPAKRTYRKADRPAKSCHCDKVDAAVIEANGRTCEGLGLAIQAFVARGMTDEARELATQLKYASKSLSWMLKEVTNRRAPSANPMPANSAKSNRGD